MDRKKYSEKELQLYDFIKLRTAEVTISLITSELGESYLGALGKLIRDELIEGKKKMMITDLNPYGRKYTKYYIIKEEKE